MALMTAGVRRAAKPSGDGFPGERQSGLPDDEGTLRHGAQADDRFRGEPAGADRLARPVPDFSTLSRRLKTLDANIPYHLSRGPRHLLNDSTGIKVEGGRRVRGRGAAA